MKVLELCRGEYTVCAVSDNRGNVKLLDFLDGLAANRRGMLNLIERFAVSGPSKNTDLCHDLGDGIWELIKGRLRVLFFYDEDKLFICTHGFVKKDRKAPKSEIASAQRDKTRYFEAKRQKILEFMEESDDE